MWIWHDLKFKYDIITQKGSGVLLATWDLKPELSDWDWVEVDTWRQEGGSTWSADVFSISISDDENHFRLPFIYFPFKKPWWLITQWDLFRRLRHPEATWQRSWTPTGGEQLCQPSANGDTLHSTPQVCDWAWKLSKPWSLYLKMRTSIAVRTRYQNAGKCQRINATRWRIWTIHVVFHDPSHNYLGTVYFIHRSPTSTVLCLTVRLSFFVPITFNSVYS
jgi:hypothetical protein